jgi:hypothetical protein
MLHRLAKTAPLWMAGVGLLVCASARAQFVPLSRCQAAFPCSIPFAVIYRPDSHLAAQYGLSSSHTPLVVSMPLKTPLIPKLETAHSPDLESALEDAIHRSLQTRRPKDGSEKSKSGTVEQPKSAPGNEPESQPPR